MDSYTCSKSIKTFIVLICINFRMVFPMKKMGEKRDSEKGDLTVSRMFYFLKELLFIYLFALLWSLCGSGWSAVA